MFAIVTLTFVLSTPALRFVGCRDISDV